MPIPVSVEEQSVMTAQHLFWTALQTKNAALFQEVLAEDFVARFPDDANQSREQFVETLTSFPAQVLSIGSDNVEVHVLGDVAVVTGVQIAQLEFIGGTQVANRIAISNVFRRADGHWWMVLSHAVELPPAAQ